MSDSIPPAFAKRFALRLLTCHYTAWGPGYNPTYVIAAELVEYLLSKCTV